MQVIVRSKRNSRSDLSKVQYCLHRPSGSLGKKLKCMQLKNSVFKEKLGMPETTFSFNQEVNHASIVTALNKNGYHFGDTLKKKTDMNVERMSL